MVSGKVESLKFPLTALKDFTENRKQKISGPKGRTAYNQTDSIRELII